MIAFFAPFAKISSTFNPKTSILMQKRHPRTRNLYSETAGASTKGRKVSALGRCLGRGKRTTAVQGPTWSFRSASGCSLTTWSLLPLMNTRYAVRAFLGAAGSFFFLILFFLSPLGPSSSCPSPDVPASIKDAAACALVWGLDGVATAAVCQHCISRLSATCRS